MCGITNRVEQIEYLCPSLGSTCGADRPASKRLCAVVTLISVSLSVAISSHLPHPRPGRSVHRPTAKNIALLRRKTPTADGPNTKHGTMNAALGRAIMKPIFL